MQPRTESLLRTIGVVERVVVVACFALMTSVMIADVLAREVFGTGFYWARQTAVYADVGIAMLGMGLASADSAHLRPRFMDGLAPALLKPYMPHIQHGLMALFCLGLAAVATTFVADSFALNEQSTVIRMPVWPVQALIPGAFALLALRHGCYAFIPALIPHESQLPPETT